MGICVACMERDIAGALGLIGPHWSNIFDRRSSGLCSGH
jgi:hypothetical protein